MRKPMLFSAAVSLVLFAEKALCYETIFSIATETFNSFRYEEMREQKAVPLSIRTGRFLSVDPKRSSARRAMPQTWNRYSYVLNNPLKYIDEKGEDITLVVRPPGDATTNFGHVAVRMYGKG